MKRKLKKITKTSLVGKLTYLQMIVSSGILLLTSLLFIAIYGIMMWNVMMDQLEMEAQLISYSIGAPIEFSDHAEAKRTLLGLKKDSSVLGALVLDKQGVVFTSFGNSLEDNLTNLQNLADGNFKTQGFNSLVYSHMIKSTTGERIGWLYIQQDLRMLKSLIYNLIWITSGIFFVGFVSSLIIAMISSKALSRPIEWIVSTAQKVSETGDYSLRVNTNARWNEIDEINFLTREFNLMLEQIQLRDSEIKEKHNQLVQSGKLAALGEMSAGVAHELNNPLHFIKGFNQRIKALYKKHESVSFDQVSTYIDKVNDNCERMRKIINHFRDFSRQEEQKLEPIDLNEVVENSFVLLNEQLRLRNIEIVKELYAGTTTILGDANRLEQVLVNLISNARDALENHEHGCVKVKTKIENSNAVVLVEDNGCGISQEQIDKIFNPFFTTKDVGKGTGLGLSITHGIVKDHQGEISCTSQVGIGTVFKISIALHENGQTSGRLTDKHF